MKKTLCQIFIADIPAIFRVFMRPLINSETTLTIAVIVDANVISPNQRYLNKYSAKARL